MKRPPPRFVSDPTVPGWALSQNPRQTSTLRATFLDSPLLSLSLSQNTFPTVSLLHFPSFQKKAITVGSFARMSYKKRLSTLVLRLQVILKGVSLFTHYISEWWFYTSSNTLYLSSVWCEKRELLLLFQQKPFLWVWVSVGKLALSFSWTFIEQRPWHIRRGFHFNEDLPTSSFSSPPRPSSSRWHQHYCGYACCAEGHSLTYLSISAVESHNEVYCFGPLVLLMCLQCSLILQQQQFVLSVNCNDKLVIH